MHRITDKYIDLQKEDLVGISSHACCERFMQRVFGMPEIDSDSIMADYVRRMILDHLFDLGLVKEHAGRVQRAVAILGRNDDVEAIAFLKADETCNHTFCMTTVIEDVPHDMDDLETYLINRGYSTV